MIDEFMVWTEDHVYIPDSLMEPFILHTRTPPAKSNPKPSVCYDLDSEPMVIKV